MLQKYRIELVIGAWWRLTGGLLLVSASACGQSIVPAAKLSYVQRFFDASQDAGTLTCHVVPIVPRLNYSFRLQTGYVVRTPMKQYLGSGHTLAVVTRVTPQGGRDPVYLASTMRLPPIPKTKMEWDIGGTFLVGEGGYVVDWMMIDDANRVCRKSWRVEAKLRANERVTGSGMAQGAVGEV